MSNQKLDQIKTAGFILKPNDSEIKTLYKQIKGQFEAKGISVILAERSADMISLDGVAFDKMCKEADFLVSLGGDGTLLSLVRRSHGYNKPFFAFNDVVITRPVVSKMATIYASIDGERFNTYKGDGLIIATPTGSTAYNLASGGPVMYPLTQALIMTPIMAHSLTQRPLVVPADFTIELSSPEERIIAVIDGQDDYEMTSEDVLVIMGAKRGARLLHRKDRNYFSVLRDKLSWGDAN
jgi:NAD+ kinase